ncbi:MAG: AAC(3) family N-acetyltransferase [Lentisphaeria bacterium]|nr:AAC(3) family N-acetyltransferase [Lentisphaeria bacterium]NQZ68021.1 AAC(3) family N-acetyltransferase [Lentisphaeria bacterium]
MTVTRKSLEQDLRKLGIKAGDRIMVHSSFKKLGLERGSPATIVQALKNVITAKGTIAMPVFTFSFSEDSAYSYHSSPSKVGAVTEAFKKSPGVKWTHQPSHSMAAWGQDAIPFLDGGNLIRPYDFQGPFGNIYKWDFKILMLGCGLAANSTLHAIEHWAELPYCVNGKTSCFFKRGAYMGREPEYSIAKDVNETCLDYMPVGHRDFYNANKSKLASKYARLLNKKGILKEGQTGTAISYVMSAADTVDACMAQLDKTPDLFLCDQCDFCLQQKKSLAKWKLNGASRWDWVRLGRAKVTITPPLDALANHGWGEAAPIQDVLDDLYARVLFFRLKEKVHILISLDLLITPKEVSDKIRDHLAQHMSISAENITIVSTHTHYGPHIGSDLLWGKKSYRDERYIDELVHRVTGAVRMASKQAIPVTVRQLTRKVDIGAINRRIPVKNGSVSYAHNAGLTPTGPISKDFTMLFFHDPAGKLIAGAGHYNCHPIFTDPAAQVITSEYPGIFSTEVEKELGPESVICFLPGAQGNQMPRLFADGYQGAKDAGLKLSQCYLKNCKKVGEPMKELASETQFLVLKKATIELSAHLQALRLGPVILGLTGGEMDLELIAYFRKKSGLENALLVGYANDFIGYLPVKAAFTNPCSYEVIICKNTLTTKPGISEDILNATAKLAKKLMQKTKKILK